MSLSIIFMADTASSANTAMQVVPTTKRVSHKVYRKGRWVTKTTWRHGKRISKKVWVKGKGIGRGVGHKTHDIIMGPSKPKP